MKLEFINIGFYVRRVAVRMIGLVVALVGTGRVHAGAASWSNMWCKGQYEQVDGGQLITSAPSGVSCSLAPYAVGQELKCIYRDMNTIHDTDCISKLRAMGLCQTSGDRIWPEQAGEIACAPGAYGGGAASGTMIISGCKMNIDSSAGLGGSYVFNYVESCQGYDNWFRFSGVSHDGTGASYSEAFCYVDPSAYYGSYCNLYANSSYDCSRAGSSYGDAKVWMGCGLSFDCPQPECSWEFQEYINAFYVPGAMAQRTGYCMTGTLGSNDWFVYAEGHLTELIYKFCYADQTDDYIDDMIGWYSGCAVTDCLYSSGYYLNNAGLTPENLVNGASGVCWACSGLGAPNVSGVSGFLYYVDTSKGYGAQNCVAVPGSQKVSGSDPAGKYTIRVSATCPYK